MGPGWGLDGKERKEFGALAVKNFRLLDSSMFRAAVETVCKGIGRGMCQSTGNYVPSKQYYEISFHCHCISGT